MKESLTKQEILFIEILKSYIQAGVNGMPRPYDLVGYARETYKLAVYELENLDKLTPTKTGDE